MVLAPASYEARLAQLVLLGTPDGSLAAMTLLERCEPQTIGAAIALVAGQGRLTVDAFDRLADAWETYRHLKHLGWD
jgi:hypothetical protein